MHFTTATGSILLSLVMVSLNAAVGSFAAPIMVDDGDFLEVRDSE
jgi:pyruvate/2-oxoacid:ferredoxin oxidoreductase alpha subunit